MVLLVDHLGKFSLPANQYRVIFWFTIPVVLYLLTFWTIKRKNACLAILAHLVLECLLIAYLGFGA